MVSAGESMALVFKCDSLDYVANPKAVPNGEQCSPTQSDSSTTIRRKWKPPDQY
ncbi:hypothetical protein SAMN04487948_11421 [Halogranum amylolyticum]|uniref:Uncharacterized protein n=1 Tax=Halogranum amylolyticum TaxID=660520 RepID=A0A1H8V3Z4_9EURY|nr:hypothetical protein SAMN04487948_11421 [Halogranum amylolyticum]